MAPRELRIDPAPDFSRLERVLRRDGVPDRVPFFELFSNIEPEVLRAIGRWQEKPRDVDPETWALQQRITYQHHLGYDYVNVAARNMRFPQKPRPHALTREGERSYLTGAHHTIASRQDFETYPWPDMSQIDYTPLDTVAPMLPEGMKVVSLGPGGILENVMWLLGAEGISYMLYDDEPLVRDMFDAVGTRLIAYFDALASFDVVGAVVLGDDMGFRTQTLVSPQVLRQYVFPYYRKLVATVHAHGKPVALHSCGNLSEVMADIIDCGWDAKHSFEDAIQPVWEAKATYGDCIALLGGFDMDAICRMSEPEVRQQTRTLIDACAPGGGWALGTGNSVASYVPVNSFLAMLEEGFAAGAA